MLPHNYQNSSSSQPASQGYYIETAQNQYPSQDQYYIQTNQTELMDVGDINFDSSQTPANRRPNYMYRYYFDQNTGQRQWNLSHMFPNYYKHFKGLQRTLEELAQTINKKWTEQQKFAYVTYLTDVNNYIKQYIWTKQIVDFNQFQQAMTSYSEYTNIMGAQIYNEQLEYLHKKSTGYDFFQDKKKKKLQKKDNEVKQQKPQPPVIKQVKEKKQEEITRSLDPIINFSELFSRKWPEDKYTNLQIFKKENANIVFIGHVDSGKSTLTGNILKELNQVDEQQWARAKLDAKQNHMQSWELAGISDVDPTERLKGITIEYAKLIFSYGVRRFTLFDAPGHKNFVPNMIMGACQADIAVLIISAKSGEFESGFVKEGQTREHALLAKCLGVTSIVVAVTKMSTVDWAEQRFNEIKSMVEPFLRDTCGYSECKFIPIDSISNLNVHKPVESTWYKDDFLLKALENIKLPQRNIKGPLRLPIIDKFKEVGNLYIYGKLESGILTQNQTVTILPQRKQLKVQEIFNAKDQKLPYAIAGENVKLRIKGLQEDEIKRGNIVCNNMNYCLESLEFKAVITVVELPDQKKLLSNGYEGIIHIHAVSQNIEIIKVESKINKEKKTVPATYLLPGETGNVIIKVQNPICLEKYEFMANLGRFTLRDQGKTIGYGQVTKIKPAKTLMKEQKEQSEAKREVKEATN